MFVEHPEFSDILVDIDTHKTVKSKDEIRLFTYDGNSWISNNNQVYESSMSREQFILHYCRYDEGKHIYNYSG